MITNPKGPMCRWSKKTRPKGRTKAEKQSYGGYRKITRYPDGSSIEHHGGPVGDVYIDEEGEEC